MCFLCLFIFFQIVLSPCVEFPFWTQVNSLISLAVKLIHFYTKTFILIKWWVSHARYPPIFKSELHWVFYLYWSPLNMWRALKSSWIFTFYDFHTVPLIFKNARSFFLGRGWEGEDICASENIWQHFRAFWRLFSNLSSFHCYNIIDNR